VADSPTRVEMIGAYRDAMTTDPYLFVADLASEAPIPHRGIHSQTLSRADGADA
jgi:hypothetical protein